MEQLPLTGGNTLIRVTFRSCDVSPVCPGIPELCCSSLPAPIAARVWDRPCCVRTKPTFRPTNGLFVRTTISRATRKLKLEAPCLALREQNHRANDFLCPKTANFMAE